MRNANVWPADATAHPQRPAAAPYRVMTSATGTTGTLERSPTTDSVPVMGIDTGSTAAWAEPVTASSPVPARSTRFPGNVFRKTGRRPSASPNGRESPMRPRVARAESLNPLSKAK